jgi:phosphoribosyl 1,2-cyclic phosphate phosphodiesterase
LLNSSENPVYWEASRRFLLRQTANATWREFGATCMNKGGKESVRINLMKLKFLGTSAAWPLPRMGCGCGICSSPDPHDTRRRASALVNDFFLIDSGFDIYNQLTTHADPTQIKYVYITHDHPDHYAGLWDLSHIVGIKPTLIIHPNTYKTISKWIQKGEFGVFLLEEGDKFSANGLEISNAWVHHTKDTSFGILVKDQNSSLFYMPDFKTLPETTKNKIKGFDMMVMDSAEWEIPNQGHQTVLEGLELAKELKVKQAYFTHIGHRTRTHTEFSAYLTQNAPEVHVPYDGLEINI